MENNSNQRFLHTIVEVHCPYQSQIKTNIDYVFMLTFSNIILLGCIRPIDMMSNALIFKEMMSNALIFKSPPPSD